MNNNHATTIASTFALLALTACGGSSGGSSGSALPVVTPPIVSSMPPVSAAPLKAGVYLKPWNESATTIAALPDLHPGVIRIAYPAFPLMTHNVDSKEAERLVGIVEGDIAYARSIGALPLIVTTLGTASPATEASVYNSRGDVAAYYADVARRFPGMAWEIGNEVEMRSKNGDEPLLVTTYAAVFQSHADAIRAADPTAKLVTAGTSGFAGIWIRAVLALTHPDAVGVHPYGTAPQNYASAVAAIGTNLPVWFTEFGTQNSPTQAQEVTDYLSHARGVVPVAVWFALSDLSADNGETFGLMDSQGNHRPSYIAAKAAFARASVTQ